MKDSDLCICYWKALQLISMLLQKIKLLAVLILFSRQSIILFSTVKFKALVWVYEL